MAFIICAYRESETLLHGGQTVKFCLKYLYALFVQSNGHHNFKCSHPLPV